MESLMEPCIQCNKDMPLEELVCPSCGYTYDYVVSEQVADGTITYKGGHMSPGIIKGA